MIRIFDVIISFFGIIFLSPFLTFIYFLLYLNNQSPIFKQKRIGKNHKPFTLLKFRTMRIGTSNTPTHLIDRSRVTKIGFFLRETKIDELPQLFNVLIGDMSIVGPRPSLCSQIDLISLRKKYFVHKFKPGITGLSQLKGIDMSDPYLLAKTDANMIKSFNLAKYFLFIFLTIIGKGFGDKVDYLKNK